LSSTGNRNNPNGTRVQGKPDEASQNLNRSDVTKDRQADSKTTGGRASATGGSQQETREHNKPDRQGQSGHKPQRHSPVEEKH
jgi:hypothetical protein